ncbi:hypothetical protein [Micromonospora sp. NPDC006431]|uniref:hypothetical protein n=1 Tax=Micromonospora sp. NPDC006431 TaxID=3364235 RepID=UPI0036970785
MGASQWRYMVAYQDDVGAALQQLRQEVYDRGEYYREPAEGGSDLDLTEEEFRARLDPRNDDDGFNDAIIEDWRERKRRPVPVDPDTLLAAQPHSGTHSVIVNPPESWRAPLCGLGSSGLGHEAFVVDG